MWFALLSRFWQPLAAIALVIGAWAWAHHQGFESGYAASEAHYTPLIAAAERARDAANSAARQKEADSKALSQQIEARHVEIEASLSSRADAAEHRYADILRHRSANSSCGAVPKDGGPATDPDATRASSELVDRTSRDFRDLARRCESDASQLSQLQDWIRGQLAIQRR